tara:strand:- start:25 stop:267 length:243 start_codon:yes stop_codon:yes gene_type:complete
MVADSKYSPASTKRKDLANVRDGKMSAKRFAEIHGVMPNAVVRQQTTETKRTTDKAMALMKARKSPTHLIAATQAGTRNV